ncbi:unnamed protein product, partial [Polarella glacialis]
AQPPPAAPSSSLRVNGLKPGTTAEDLAKLFGQYGHLLSTSVKRQRPVINSGQLKWPAVTGGGRLGFVQFATSAEAQQALHALNGAMVGGGTIYVEAEPADAAEIKS